MHSIFIEHLWTDTKDFDLRGSPYSVRNKSKAGFTLMEVMVVVIIVGIVAVFAVPNYKKSMQTTYRKDAEENLILIHAAQEIYAVHNGGNYWDGGSGDLAAINTTLHLNIISNGFTYNCGQAAGVPSDFVCTANRTDGSFSIIITEDPISLGANPSCVGNCP